MKNYLLLLVLSGVAVCSAETLDDESPENIDELCGPDIDLACVKNYIGEKGSCSVVDEVNEDPIYEENLPIYLPSVNLTVVTTKTTLSNLKGKIEEFYYNNKTEKLVISVNFEGLVCDAPDTIFAISQNGREPEVFTEDVKATYPAVLTAVIPARHGLTKESLRWGYYSAYFANSDADIVLGPKFTESQDPMVKAVLDGILEDLPTALVEIFRTKASYFFLAYLQNNICDFDVNPVLEKYDMTVLNSNKDIDVDDTQFEEPCSNSNADDVTDCVRNYFKENGKCLVVTNSNDKPLQRGKFIIPIPSLNSTVFGFGGEFRHGTLRGMIQNFYINKQTGNLVLSVEFIASTMFAPLVDLYTSQRGKENTLTSDYTTNIYPVIITAVIPISEGLTPAALMKAFVSGHFTQPPMFVIGPNYTENTDPGMNDLIDIVFNDAMTIGQECLVTEAFPLFLAYLQKYLCDFKIMV